MSEILASPAFLGGTAVLIILALVFLLAPLLRGGAASAATRRRLRALEELRDDLDPGDYERRRARLREEAESSGGGARPNLAMVVLLALAVPACAVAAYLYVGTPEGIDPDTGRTGEIRQTLGELTQRVRSEPQDVEAWNQLGMIQKQLQQFPAAEAAFRRVIFIDPDNQLARVELAETLLYMAGQASLPDESRRLLRRVLAAEPDNQKALWLAGLDAFHEGDRDRALALWRRLERQLPEGSVRDQIRRQIADAAGRPAETSNAAANGADGEPETTARRGADIDESPSGTVASTSPAPPPSQTSTAADDGEVSVAVNVSLDSALSGSISGSETVFVFARAVNGPPAPLAVKRLPASTLPATVVLSESDSMAEGLTLGTFPQARVVARLSRSGNVIASPGDLEGSSEPFAPGSTGHIDIVIDRQVD
ncbi:MAG: c-type cytochrome biogenesis protein CcmI/CycH [Candidatus Wenzhouxiangella sp. M2_3B_020]